MGDVKQVVYLIGAGATHAEILHRGAPIVNMLMSDSRTLGPGVSRRILARLTARERELLGPTDIADIEKLISLLAACGVRQMSDLAEKLRRYYFEDLCTKIPNRVLRGSMLADGLLGLHRTLEESRKAERLVCLLSTNHDGLLQRSSQKVFEGLNLGFPFVSNEFRHNDALFPILQLHGSFTWRFGVPTIVEPISRQSKYRHDIAWIPPTIAKEAKQFPYNKLMGIAYEILAKNCDVLRIIGASLTQNDWNILSLIFNAQKHRELTRGAAFRVELILPHDAGVAIQSQCSYLRKIVPIGNLTDGDFSPYLELQGEDPPSDSDLSNPFAYWLKQKINYHRARGHLSETLHTSAAKFFEEAA